MEKHRLEFNNFLAGEFPIAKDNAIAAGTIKCYEIIAETSAGILPATKDTLGNVIGIAMNDAEEDGIVNFYMTGEFHHNAIVPIEGVTASELKAALRKISIFLK